MKHAPPADAVAVVLQQRVDAGVLLPLAGDRLAALAAAQPVAGHGAAALGLPPGAGGLSSGACWFFAAWGCMNLWVITVLPRLVYLLVQVG